MGRRYRAGVRCEVLAVGTELLLGQIVDTNSSWIGERLAELGIDTLEHVKVGDNEQRIVVALERLLEQSDAVIVCGGLGPTPDDITRECLAIVMGRAVGRDGPVPLERRQELIDHIAAMFSARGRDFPANNLRQADVPQGADVIDNPIGTAPGLRCPVGDKVVYAVPGVPYEMQRMVSRARAAGSHVAHGRAGGDPLADVEDLGRLGVRPGRDDRRRASQAQTNPTIAFLARGIEGICVRVTAKAASADAAAELVATEEAALRSFLGDLVFAVDDETMEHAVLALLQRRGWTLAVAESVTGGLVAARIAAVPGASATFRGGVVSYATEVKRTLLGVTAEDVVTDEAARQMADGVRRALGADVGIATTGVAGPEPMEGQPVGTVWMALALPGVPLEAVSNRLPGDRDRIRQFASIGLLNLLRMRLLALDHG